MEWLVARSVEFLSLSKLKITNHISNDILINFLMDGTNHILLIYLPLIKPHFLYKYNPLLRFQPSYLPYYQSFAKTIELPTSQSSVWLSFGFKLMSLLVLLAFLGVKVIYIHGARIGVSYLPMLLTYNKRSCKPLFDVK